MPFSDMRPGGMNTHPELKAQAKRIFKAIGERPNRFDYWVSENYKSNMLSKIQYSTLILTDPERSYLDELIRKDLGLF